MTVTPVHPKAWGAAAGGALLGVVLAIFTAVQTNPGLLAPLPKGWQVFILALVPSVLAFAGAWSVGTPVAQDPTMQRGVQ